MSRAMADPVEAGLSVSDILALVPVTEERTGVDRVDRIEKLRVTYPTSANLSGRCE